LITSQLVSVEFMMLELLELTVMRVLFAFIELRIVLLNMMEFRLMLPFSRLSVIFVFELFESWITLLMIVQFVFTELIMVEFMTMQFVRLLLKMLLSNVMLKVSLSANSSPSATVMKVPLTKLVSMVPLLRV